MCFIYCMYLFSMLNVISFNHSACYAILDVIILQIQSVTVWSKYPYDWTKDMFRQYRLSQRGKILRIPPTFHTCQYKNKFDIESDESSIFILFTASSSSYRLVIRTHSQGHTHTNPKAYFTHSFISALQQHQPELKGEVLGDFCWKCSVSRTSYDLIRSYLTLSRDLRHTQKKEEDNNNN